MGDDLKVYCGKGCGREAAVALVNLDASAGPEMVGLQLPMCEPCHVATTIGMFYEVKLGGPVGAVLAGEALQLVAEAYGVQFPVPQPERTT